MIPNKRTYLAVIPAMLGLAVTAQATTQNTWFESPGEACQPEVSSDLVTRGYFVGKDNRGYIEPGIYTRTLGHFKCPIQLVKDSDLISPGPVTVADITFVVLDRNAGSNDFDCYARLFDENGGLWESPITYTPPGGLDVLQTFTIWDPFSGKTFDLAHYSGDSLVLLCFVPDVGTVGTGTSGVVMYRASFQYENLP